MGFDVAAKSWRRRAATSWRRRDIETTLLRRCMLAEMWLIYSIKHWNQIESNSLDLLFASEL